MQSEISVLAVIVFTYFCLQIVLKIITTLIIADQQPARASFIDVLGQILSLIFILILVKNHPGITDPAGNRLMPFTTYRSDWRQFDSISQAVLKNTDRAFQKLNSITPKAFLTWGFFSLSFK